MSHFFSRENRGRRLLVAVRAGVQLCMFVTSSLSAKEHVRITHQRGAMFPKKLAQGHAACGACLFCVIRRRDGKGPPPAAVSARQSPPRGGATSSDKSSGARGDDGSTQEAEEADPT